MYIYTKAQSHLTHFAFPINYGLSDKRPCIYYVSILTGWVVPKKAKKCADVFHFTSTGFTRSLMLERGGFLILFSALRGFLPRSMHHHHQKDVAKKL